MKKLILLFTLFILITGSADSLLARRERNTLNLGILTEDSLKFDPFFFNIGLSTDIRLNRTFFLCAEGNLITYKFKFDSFHINPAITINADLGRFFVGGGFGKYFGLGNANGLDSDIMLRLQGGIRKRDFQLRIFFDMNSDNMFKNMLMGFQIGIFI